MFIILAEGKIKMKLQQYLDEKKQTVADLARALEVQHTVALRWAKDIRIPSKENMQKIYEWSGGEVEPNDFYNVNKESEHD